MSAQRKSIPAADPTSLTYSEKYSERAALIAGFLDKFGPLIDQLHAIEDDDGWNVLNIQIWSTHQITLAVQGKNSREVMRTVRRAIGGQWEKGGYGDVFNIFRKWGTDAVSIGINIQADRSRTCEKVVTGTEEIHHDAIPAIPARTEIVEKVEWVCGNLLED